MNEESWKELRRQFPWPAQCPNVTGQWANKMHGWLSRGTWEMIRKHMPTSGLILELGTWMGKSAQRMLSAESTIRLVCIDTWEGSPEINTMHRDMLPAIFDHCRYHLWPYKDRVVLVKATTIEGMEILAGLGICPSMVYVDARHESEYVENDVRTSVRLFPEATLIGDDWTRMSVREGVITALGHLAPCHLVCNEAAWSLK